MHNPPLLTEQDLADLGTLSADAIAALADELVDGLKSLVGDIDAPVCETLMSLDGTLCGKPAAWLAVASCGCDVYVCQRHHEKGLASMRRTRGRTQCGVCRTDGIAIDWRAL
jgi:hypothetical protein